MVAKNATGSLVADLEPGQYLVACLIPGPDGIPHATKGMLANVEVTASGSPAGELIPEDAPVVTLQDFEFHLPPYFGKGSFVVENSGSYIHEFGIARLHDGKTIDDVKAYEQLPPAKKVNKPYDDDAGTTFLDPGSRARIDLDLAPGRYAAVCFIPAPEGKPHFVLGMIHEFTVS